MRRRVAFWTVGLPTFVLLVSFPVWALLPNVQKVREAAVRTTPKNNLKQIGDAVHSYQDAHGPLSPASDPNRGGFRTTVPTR